MASIQNLLDEKRTKLLVLKKFQSKVSQDITDIEEQLQQETAHVDQEKADQLSRLSDELSLLKAVPPAVDGKDDQRRLRQQSKRSLTEKEVRLMQKKSMTLGKLFLLFTRVFGTAQLVEIRSLRHDIMHEWRIAQTSLERDIKRLDQSRLSNLQRKLQIELSQKKREFDQREEKLELLQIEIASLKLQLAHP